MHTGTSRLESCLRLIHETRCRHAMDLFQTGIEFQRLQPGLVVVVHLLIAIHVRIAAELADQHLAEPVVVLRGHSRGDAHLGNIARPIARRQLACHLDQFIKGLGWLGDARLVKQARVIKQCERTHSRWQRPILAVAFHGLHHGEKFCVHLFDRECIGGQRLDQFGFHIVIQPAVKQLHHIRSLSRRDRGRHLGAVIRIGEMGHLDSDVRVCRLGLTDRRAGSWPDVLWRSSGSGPQHHGSRFPAAHPHGGSCCQATQRNCNCVFAR